MAEEEKRFQFLPEKQPEGRIKEFVVFSELVQKKIQGRTVRDVAFSGSGQKELSSAKRVFFE
jgi:hypothetical protein